MIYEENLDYKEVMYKKTTFNLLFLFILTFPIIQAISNEFIPIGNKYLGLLLIGVWGVQSIKYNRIYLSNTGILLFSLYVFWNIASTLWSANPYLSINQSMGLIQVFLLYCVILDVGRSTKRIIRLIKAYVIGVAILTSTMLYNILTGHTYEGLSNRYSAMGFDPNNFSILLVSTIPLAIVFFKKYKIGFLYALLSIPLVISTASRGALVALIVIAFVYLISYMRSLKKLIFFGMLLGLVVFIVPYIVPEEAMYRLTNQLSDASAGGRSQAWLLGLQVGAENLFLGIGAGAFVDISYNYIYQRMQMHNTFIANWAELGLFGILLWIFLWLIHFRYVLFTRSANKGNSEMKIALLLSLTSVLIGASYLNWQIQISIYLVWAFIMCFYFVDRKLQSRTKLRSSAI